MRSRPDTMISDRDPCDIEMSGFSRHANGSNCSARQTVPATFMNLFAP